MEGEEVAKILTKYVQKMKISGYDEKMRREVIDEGVKRYREQVTRDDRGERPLYRSRHDDRVERKEQKLYRRETDTGGRRRGEGREILGPARTTTSCRPSSRCPTPRTASC